MLEHSDDVTIDPFAELVGCDVMELIAEVAPRKVLSRVGKALDYYTKAIRLVGVDDEMGAIRLIAAEEELVVANFEWLKLNAAAMPEHRDFIGRSKNHRVKLAFYPVLSQFRFALGDIFTHGIMFDGLEDVLRLHVTLARFENRIVLRISNRDGKELLTHNPLSLAVSWDNRPHVEVVDKLFRDFEDQVRDQHGMTVREFVTARADYRNKLLYAEDAGYLAMDEDLRSLMDGAFRTTLSDLLWVLAVLLTNTPTLRDWGLVSQFISLYRRVLIESNVIQRREPS